MAEKRPKSLGDSSEFEIRALGVRSGFAASRGRHDGLRSLFPSAEDGARARARARVVVPRARTRRRGGGHRRQQRQRRRRRRRRRERRARGRRRRRQRQDGVERLLRLPRPAYLRRAAARAAARLRPGDAPVALGELHWAAAGRTRLRLVRGMYRRAEGWCVRLRLCSWLCVELGAIKRRERSTTRAYDCVGSVASLNRDKRRRGSTALSPTPTRPPARTPPGRPPTSCRASR